MKSIEALKALENLPSSVQWYVLYFECYKNADNFCLECFGKKAKIMEVRPLAGNMVLTVAEPLRTWSEDAPAFDAVVVDPDGYKLNAQFIYMIED